MLFLNSSKGAISWASSVLQVEVDVCLFLSVQKICAIWLHDFKGGCTAKGGCGCYQVVNQQGR
jgi:hypothetical protein